MKSKYLFAFAIVTILAVSIASSVFAMGNWWGGRPDANQQYQYQITPACTAPGVVNYTLKAGQKVKNPLVDAQGKCPYSAANGTYAWEQGSYPICYNPAKPEVKPC